MVHHWLKIPSDDELMERANWNCVRDNTFAGSQLTLLLIRKKADEPVSGYPVERLLLIGGAEFEIGQNVLKIERSESKVQHALRRTIEKRSTTQISSRVSSEIQGNLALVSAKLGAELKSTFTADEREELTRELAQETASSVEFSREYTNTIRVKSQKDADETLWLFTQYWPYTWDVFLHSAEYIEFDYETRSRLLRIFLEDSRTEKRKLRAVVKLPLVRLIFYEPQRNLGLTRGSQFRPAVQNPEQIKAIALSDQMPSLDPPDGGGLAHLASIAFPIGEAERQAAAGARSRRKRPTVARAKKVAKRAKKPAKKKARKVTKKKYRRPAKRKAAKRSARR